MDERPKVARKWRVDNVGKCALLKDASVVVLCAVPNGKRVP